MPPEQINVNSQVSDTPEIHGMMLKYSDDEVTDEEMRELNLQTAAQQYMMQQDAQNKITPLHFQQSPKSQQTPVSTDDHYLPDGQNTWLSQVAQKQPAQLPDGSPRYRLQIPYLQEFFDTHWYFVQDCTFELYAIYDATFVEIPYHAQSQPFNLVALDTDLQKHLDDRVNQISAKTDQLLNSQTHI